MNGSQRIKLVAELFQVFMAKPVFFHLRISNKTRQAFQDSPKTKLCKKCLLSDKTYKIWVIIDAEVLRGIFYEPLNVVENKASTFHIIRLLWNLKL